MTDFILNMLGHHTCRFLSHHTNRRFSIEESSISVEESSFSIEESSFPYECETDQLQAPHLPFGSAGPRHFHH